MVSGLTDRFKAQRVGISLPSMRIDSVLKKPLEETSEVRKSGLTLAPEAGTQRLRDVINKGVTEDDLVTAVTDAFESGWNTVKLYFMIGLPTETDDDLQAIGALAKLVVDAYHAVPRERRAPGLRVTCSASTFVPKPFTPFQWAAQDALEEINRKQTLLRGALRIKGVQFNWHDPELSFLEACLARGDRRVGDVLAYAWQRGCRRMDGAGILGMKRGCRLLPMPLTRLLCQPRARAGRLLPWDFIDAGVTKKYLWRENVRARQGDVTPDCRNGCQGCGLQRFEGVCTR